MSRVRFKKSPRFAPAENTVQDLQLGEVFWVAARLTDDLDKKSLVHAPLSPAELTLWTDEHEIVSMYYAT